jgi:hypothetical protein
VALARLHEEGLIVSPSAEVVALSKAARDSLPKAHEILREKETLILSSILQHAEPRGDCGERLLDDFRRCVDTVLLWMGEELAEQVLFSRFTPEDLSERLTGLLASTSALQTGEADCLRRAIHRLLFEMTGEEEEWFFRKLQGHFIVRAYVLHPSSEALLRDFAASHKLYVDSSIVLPAIAAGHPYARAYADLLGRTRRLGVRLLMTTGILSEVTGHINSAIRQFEELQQGDLRRNLGAYKLCTGTAAGNVFLEGLERLLAREEEVIGWRGYLRHLTSSQDGRLHADEEKVREQLEVAYGIAIDEYAPTAADEGEIAYLERVILACRPARAGDFTGTQLTRHEATQLYRVEQVRKSEPNGAHLVWFLTTDTHIAKMQMQTRDRFPLPMVYYPAKWSIYLDTIDHSARSSRHFSALMKRVEYGPFSGSAAIDLLRYARQKAQEAHIEGQEAEIVQTVLRDFHNTNLAPNGAAWDDDAARCAAARDQITTMVFKTKAEMETLQARLHGLEREASDRDAEHQKEKERLRKQIARKDHQIGILKGQLKSPRGK